MNPVASNGFFRVIIPIDQAIVPSNGPICKIDVSMVSLNCRIVYKTSTDIWIDIAQSCVNGCAAGTNVNLVF